MPTFDTPEPISATVDIASGDVRLSAGDRSDTVVTVEPNDASSAEDRKAAEQTRVDYANARLLVTAPKRSWPPRRGGGSVRVTIELPAGSNVHGTGGMVDFRGDGPLGECRIKIGLGRIRLDGTQALTVKTGAGDVDVDQVAGHADITVGSGDVRVRELDASAAIKNTNGDTWVGVAGGDLRVGAANGSIAIDVAHATVGAKSAKGDVRVGEIAHGSVVLETHLGDLEVGIREETAAWLDLRTTAGAVNNTLDAADAPEPSAETVEVRARTTVGDILVRRARRDSQESLTGS